MPLLLLAGACGRGHAVTVKLSETDGPNITMVLRVGDRIRLELPAQPSTGFSWNLVKKPSARVLQLGKTLREDGGLMGGPGTQSYSWQVLQPGEDDLLLQYNRSFERDVKPAKSLSIHLAVTGGEALSAATLLGRYSGQQPCADCSGIQQELVLYTQAPNDYRNAAYILKRTYQGTRNGNLTMVESGSWTILRGTHADVNATVYQLDGEGRPQYFQLMGDRLVPLDDQQIPLPGPAGMDLALHKLP